MTFNLFTKHDVKLTRHAEHQTQTSEQALKTRTQQKTGEHSMSHASPIVNFTMALCNFYNARRPDCNFYIVNFTRQDRMGCIFSVKKRAGFGVL